MADRPSASSLDRSDRSRYETRVRSPGVDGCRTERGVSGSVVEGAGGEFCGVLAGPAVDEVVREGPASIVVVLNGPASAKEVPDGPGLEEEVQEGPGSERGSILE